MRTWGGKGGEWRGTPFFTREDVCLMCGRKCVSLLSFFAARLQVCVTCTWAFVSLHVCACV